MQIYHRQASGLVREGRPLDAAVFNLFGATFGPVVAWVLLYAVGFYPGSNVLLTVLLTCLFCVGMNVVYMLFATIMPRSGGDYVFISRTFKPWVGFAANASFMLWLTFYIGTAGALFGQMGLGPALRVLAESSGNLGLATVGDWFQTDLGKFVSGLAMIAITGPVVIMGRRGLRTYFRFQRWVFALCGLTLVVSIVAMVIMSHDGFVTSFNSYAETFSGKSDTYGFLVSEGGGHGGFSFEQTLLATTWPFYGAAFLVQSAFWAGESRTGLKSNVIGITVPFIVAIIVLLVAVASGLSAFGSDFLTGVALVDPSLYGMTFSPFFAELTAAWTGPIVGVVLTFGLGAWFISYVPFITVMVTRSMTAWSVDGVMPEWLGRVDERSSNPVNATLVTFACAIVFLALYSFTETFSVVTALLGFALTFLITCVAAIVFPYRRKSMYEGSPGDKRILGVPLLSVAGVFGTLGLGVMIVLFLRDPSSGTNWPANKGQVLAMVGVFVAMAIVYAIVAFARRRRGLDLGPSFQALPEE